MKSAPPSARRFRFPDGPEVGPQKPEKPAASSHDDCCPCCQRSLPGSGTSVWGLLELGLRQLVGAVWMIATGIVRCLRFAVAGVLCLVGLIGSCCFGLASRVAHRDDRKLLFRR
jgi:hypothetical protein